MERTDRELLELIANKVGGLETEFVGMKADFGELKTDVSGLKTRMQALENATTKTALIIENEIMPKIEVLFDGHIQNSDKLDRIEKEVSRQEEVILRKVK